MIKNYRKNFKQINMKICWITMYVRDMKESLQFYTQILGLEVKRLLVQALTWKFVSWKGMGQTWS